MCLPKCHECFVLFYLPCGSLQLKIHRLITKLLQNASMSCTSLVWVHQCSTNCSSVSEILCRHQSNAVNNILSQYIFCKQNTYYFCILRSWNHHLLLTDHVLGNTKELLYGSTFNFCNETFQGLTYVDDKFWSDATESLQSKRINKNIIITVIQTIPHEIMTWRLQVFWLNDKAHGLTL